MPIQDILPSQRASPASGRLCRRALREGEAIVGVLHFPCDVDIQEGAAYLLIQAGSALTMVRQPLELGLPEHLQSYGAGDLLRAPIWRQSNIPGGIMVRFIAAFPENNGWAVYGASNQSPGPDAPDHAWFDVGSPGTANPIDAPLEASGLAMSQLLTSPVWPDASGAIHSLSQLQSPWRRHYHDYHLLLASAARDETISAQLEARVAKHPRFAQLNIGRINRNYCAYLAELEYRGELVVDGPMSAAVCAHREELSAQILKEAAPTENKRSSSTP
jgi:hypothetical protein